MRCLPHISCKNLKPAKKGIWLTALAPILALAFISFKSCGPAEDENYPGLCTLSCDGAQILPPGDYAIEPLFETAAFSYLCSGPHKQPLPFEKPELLKFRVVKKNTDEVDKKFGGVQGDIGSPLASVRVNISTTGYVWSTDPEHNKVAKIGEGKLLEYTGIATTQDQWCSDSCGVVSVAVHLVCPIPDNSLQGALNIASGVTGFSTEIETSNETEANDS